MTTIATQQLSGLTADGGAIIERSGSVPNIAGLDRDAVVRIFEHHGVILFRGFALTPPVVLPFTDQYTEKYAPDAIRRQERYGPKGEVRTVDEGNERAPLHSEASFGATWPEIIWFLCNIPSSSGGYTTLCDGVKLWDQLSRTTQAFFLAQPLLFQIKFPTGTSQPGRGKIPWPFPSVGVVGQWDKGAGIIELNVLRYALQEARNRRLWFANHVICTDPIIDRMGMADGSTIPAEITAEVERASVALTIDLHWEAGDLLMLDNRRFLHGRREFAEGDRRDIVQLQTALASFAYGSTSRETIVR